MTEQKVNNDDSSIDNHTHSQKTSIRKWTPTKIQEKKKKKKRQSDPTQEKILNEMKPIQS